MVFLLILNKNYFLDYLQTVFFFFLLLHCYDYIKPHYD
jgi:hypothetical protein